MLFEQIVGLDSTKNRLLQVLTSGHIAHAQLFFGNEGGASLAIALAYARYLHCEVPQSLDACGKCSACRKHNKMIHPDMHFVFPSAITAKVDSKPMSRDFMVAWRELVLQHPYFDLQTWLKHIGAENKQGNISVEESREIVKTLSLKPFEAAHKILMIWLPEIMNIQAANALLKVLEEPPPQTVFLLVSQDIKRLLVTIISRLQVVQVPAFSDTEVGLYLQKNLKTSPEEAAQIAYLADGNLAQAYHLRRDGLGEDLHTWLVDWLRSTYKGIWADCLQHTEVFASWNKDQQKNLLLYTLNICRECLLWQGQSSTLLRITPDKLKFIEGFAKIMPPNKIEVFYKELGNTLYYIERNASAKMSFFDLTRQVVALMKG